MLKQIVLTVVFALSAVTAQFSSRGQASDVYVLDDQRDNGGDGNFNWLFSLSDGSRVEQSGYTKANPDPAGPDVQVIKGSYTYTAENGEVITVNYIADENGFQPDSASLPTPPPVPQAIQKALNTIYSNNERQASASTNDLRRYRPPRY